MRALIFLLTHQNAEDTQIRVETWLQVVPPEDLVIVSDQSEEEFAKIPHPHKIRSVDPRRMTRDHQRELQSVTSACQEVSRWMVGQDFTHVFMAEFDLFPLTRELLPRLREILEESGADILAHELKRVDRTNNASYLYHSGRPGFAEFWRKVSVRKGKDTILSMLGTGSFWKRAAFDAVCAHDEPMPMYLEIYLPTLAHHLGYRLIDLGPESRYVRGPGDFSDRIEEARATGALFIHPVKSISQPLELAHSGNG
jgi:hypothetical protein